VAHDEVVRVVLVQQGVWEMPTESMPLAVGYLKAAVQADERLRWRTDVRIANYRGGVGLGHITDDLFRHGVPDVLAFSVLGWNYRTFGAVAETFKQLNPRGWVVFGGTHAAHQGERTFRMFPEVDVVVDGEGERVFTQLLHAHIDGADPRELVGIAGITYRTAAGERRTNPGDPPLRDLSLLPSPILTGAIGLERRDGSFPYDVALMETNRGCPYKCAFCYWGGATGQKVRAFPRERLRAELEEFGRRQVHTVVLCDANFGMLPADEQFVEDLLSIRGTYGYPRALETSWAKNKSETFYRIVREMKRSGLRSSFTLALQTLNESALERMHRRNMKLNDWEDLATWLAAEGLECYAELIWGAPGDTPEAFLEGYDRLAQTVSRVAVYPLLLLPNTDYHDKREDFGFVTVRGDHDDFQYVLAHDTMTAQDNQQMLRFIFWARALAENLVFRHLWVPLRVLGGVAQSQAIRSFADWVEASDAPAAVPLRAAVARFNVDPDALADVLVRVFGDPSTTALVRVWWDDALRPRLPPGAVPALDEVLRYDLLTLPVYRAPSAAGPEAEPLPVVEAHGDRWYVREDVGLTHDVPALVQALRRGEPMPSHPRPITRTLYYRLGFDDFARSTNHEEIAHYMGVTEQELDAAAARAAATPSPEAAAALARTSSC